MRKKLPRSDRMALMNLSHYSDDPDLVPKSVAQYGGRWDKPQGLWVSVDGPNDWPEWCAREEFRDTASQNHYRVEISKAANILHIKDAMDLDDFSVDYGINERGFGEYIRIDWASVAEKYDGVIIAPYDKIMGCMTTSWWLYSWDCASGCIWNADAIDHVHLVEKGVK